jgi:hypothetical protein
LGINEVIKGEVRENRCRFSLERAIFLTVLYRRVDPGSDRAAERWKKDFHINGTKGNKSHHLYRAIVWLGESIIHLGADPRSLRYRKDLIEEELLRCKLDLFSELELAFFDTIILYFEGQGGENLGRYGLSKNYTPDFRQMVVAAGGRTAASCGRDPEGQD